MSDTVAAAAPLLAQNQLVELLDLVQDADSVELKLGVDASHQRSAVEALGLDPREAQVRLVHFFDTPELTLERAGVVVRARRVQGKGDDTVVKLRPVRPQDLSKRLRRHPEFVVEVDAMTTGFVRSGSSSSASRRRRSASPGRGAPRCASSSRRTNARSTPSTRRRASASTTSWSSARSSCSRASSWSSSGSAEAFQVAAETRAFLGERGIASAENQQTKTRKALSFFSDQLKEARDAV
jgi:hypothetical protein